MSGNPINDGLFYFKVAVATVAALFGGLPVLVQVLIALMALDVATGMLAAYVNRSLSSDVSFRGMARKAIVLLVVAVGTLLEPITDLPVAQAVAGFYAAHEGLSAVENVAKAGLPVPKVLKDALAKLSPEEGDRDQG